LLLSTQAAAHEWYEPACCAETHCRPVADGVVEQKPDGVWVSGYGILRYDDGRLRWSRDDHDHVCSNGGKLLCVYRKPSLY